VCRLRAIHPETTSKSVALCAPVPELAIELILSGHLIFHTAHADRLVISHTLKPETCRLDIAIRFTQARYEFPAFAQLMQTKPTFDRHVKSPPYTPYLIRMHKSKTALAGGFA
jgi:hypothetical protein